ncbi:acetolactate decarboxylase [Mycobacterium paragordonae]|uniref:Alpha-acetolactate decarboxylase n=1 Tax=Mycobacterium paragordonae TaxID=1389713 RepID=A0A4R5WU41_9MYCO|nr:acetolactate decarboxylase [Mycobacterium paragordonae]MDP7734230.1 acetolactate decarboxylase [Mycobacterium paragordonae]TDK97182.1 acetolactate decarboxylase [Mycobacterium paragordonae]TDL11199.1 acetolactate decarboxylase [Mycobacterium paragordonae]
MSTAREHFRRWATALLGHDAEVYQYSTIGALLDGVYDGDATVADILQHGDFGLGTFNHLDGEMVILDGVCYRLRADGTATRAAPTDRTPFAAITRFHRDFGIAIAERTDRAAVTAAIDQRITSTNLIYAIRVTGHFADLHTRTVMEQQQPYPPLTQATEGQAETRFTDVSGTLVGFRTPDFEQGISVAGYHLHFLNDDRTAGGHVLDFTLERGDVAVSGASQLHLSLPTTGAFLQARLAADDLGDQITKAEGN